MRFIAIALFLLAIPLLQAWMRQNRHQQHWVWLAFGLMPFVIGPLNLDASLISWAGWPGYVKGMLVSLLDAMAVAILLALPSKRVGTPFASLLIVYILVAMLAVANAEVKQAAFFYVWQLLRMLLVFLAAIRIASRPTGARWLLYGVMIGAIMQAVYSVGDRLGGVTQAAGTMGHQNLLGMAMHFAIYPSLALLLAGRRDKLLLLGFGSSVIAMALTGSRASIGFTGLGIILLLVLSMIRRPTGRKTGIAAAGMMALIAVAPLAYGGLSKRLTSESVDSSNYEREAFKRAAWMMIDDNPMGVGANQYVLIANTRGYSEQAGVAWSSGSRATNVHQTYLLMLAELGYIGAASFLAFMLMPIVTGFRFAWTVKGDPRGELALGLTVTFLSVAAHCLYEWIFVISTIQYLHVTTLGILAGLVQQRRVERRVQRRAAKQPESEPTESAGVMT